MQPPCAEESGLDPAAQLQKPGVTLLCQASLPRSIGLKTLDEW